MARRVKEGDLYAVALGDGCEALCRVLYKSSYFKDVVLMGCYGLSPTDGQFDENSLTLVAPPTYTGSTKLALESWRLISTRPLLPEEKAMSRRIVGGGVWLGDEHLGDASPSEFSSLPKMMVLAAPLFIKKIRNECQA